MENPEEILHSLEEFAKLKPKDIPRELEEYLCFVAKTGNPVYQWSAVKSLFREKLINVITEFYVSCPSMDIPPCPNVEMFNYDSMKNFILEKLDTFTAAPFTVQRICELLTTPRKEYNRIDKYMRALEKNILVVSTTEPGNRRNAENGDGIVNGIENEHLPEIIAIATATNDMMKDIDYNASWPRINQEDQAFINVDRPANEQPSQTPSSSTSQENSTQEETRINVEATTSTAETVITCSITESSSSLTVPAITITESEKNDVADENVDDEAQSVPAQVQKRRNSIEPITTDDNAVSEPVEKNDGLEMQSEPVVSSSETESSNSSCSNDTIPTDTSDKSENEDSAQAVEENQKVDVEIEPQIGETPLDDTPLEDAALEETPLERSPLANLPLANSSLENRPLENPPLENPPLENPPLENPPLENSPLENQSLKNPPLVKSPFERSLLEKSSFEKSPFEKSPFERSSEGSSDILPSERPSSEKLPLERSGSPLRTPLEESPIKSPLEGSPLRSPLEDSPSRSPIEESPLVDSTLADIPLQSPSHTDSQTLKNDDDKIDVEIKQDMTDSNVDYVTVTVSPSEEAGKPMAVDECQSEKDLPESQLNQPEVAVESEPKLQQSEETPMEVDVENPDSEQNVTDPSI